MSKNNASFFRQTRVLTARYFNIFFNNKKNIFMALFIPLLTMLIVAIVACGDMYAPQNSDYEEMNEGYPILSWQVQTDSEPKKWDGKASVEPKLFTITIDDEEYYAINDISDFVTVMTQGGEWLKKNYCLNNDIDLSSNEWKPIGTDENPFQGKFDGRGHTIYNLKINSDVENAGFFGYTKNAEIKNFGIDSVEIEANKSVGAIISTAYNTTIEECYVRDVKIPSNKNDAGLLCGKLLEKSKIKTCYGIAEKESKNSSLVGSTDKNSEVRYSYYVGDERRVYEDNSEKVVSEYQLKEFASTIGEKGFRFRQDQQIADYGALQIGLFMIVCVAIFVGVCNSIQEIIKERVILKREYMSGLRLSSYVVSKLIVQGVVCAVQAIIMMIIFQIAIIGRDMPITGTVFPISQMDFYMTIFLLTFAADVTALFISSIVKSSVMANTFIPIILIVQIIYSGVLFDLGGVGQQLANLMISKWGISALAAISHLNEARPKILLENPEYEQKLGEDLLKIKTMYASTTLNLLLICLVLLIFIIVFAVASRIALQNIKNDKR